MWGATEAWDAALGGKLTFQFTHPVWGATAGYMLPTESDVFQFTHPVWGATPLSA